MPDEGDIGRAPATAASGRLHRFLVARFAVSTATQMQGVAIGWYVYALTGSAFDLGLIGLVQFLPLAGLALPAGHAVDSLARRHVAMAAFAAEGLCSLTLALLALAAKGGAGAVFLVVAGYGACRAFEQPAMQSWLPALVPAEHYPRAAAANSLTAQSAVILGPSLGGLGYLLGPAVPLLAAAALQFVGLLAVLTLPATRRVAVEPLSWSTLLSGVRFIRHSEVVRGAITLDLLCVLFGGATALLPIFARDIIGVGPAGLGLLRSAPALGALVTGIVLTRRPPRRHVGHRMMIAVAVYGAATLGFALSRSMGLSMLALAVVGAGDMLSVVVRSTMIQILSPDAIRGRVSAVNSLFTGASNQLGQFESGVTAAWLGPVGSVVLGGAATLLIVAVWAKRFPALRRMDRLVPPEDAPEEAVDRARGGMPGSSDRLR